LAKAFKSILGIEPDIESEFHEAWSEIPKALREFADKCGARSIFKEVLMESLMESANKEG